jgi:hypothetical protein
MGGGGRGKKKPKLSDLSRLSPTIEEKDALFKSIINSKAPAVMGLFWSNTN